MDTRELRYFAAVYEEGSISAASKRMYIAQPSISAALAQLERRLGVRLFLRHRKGVTATPEGQDLYAVAVKLLGELEALPRLFRPSRKHAPLNLAIMPSLTGHEIRAFLRRLTDPVDAPTLRLVELSEPADARLVSDRLVQDHEHFVPLWNEKFVLALPHGHPLTLKPKIRLADLQGARMIERCHCELHDEVAGALARYRIAVDVVAKAQNDEWALALTTAGLGVSFLPADSVAERHGVVVREIEDLHLVRRIGLAYDAKAPLSSALQAVIEAYGNRGPGRKSRTAQTIEGK